LICGWVFGRTVACRHLGIDPWHRPNHPARDNRFDHLYAAFFDHVHKRQTWIADQRLALINRRSLALKWLALRKKRVRGVVRRGGSRALKWIERESRSTRRIVRTARRTIVAARTAAMNELRGPIKGKKSRQIRKRRQAPLLIRSARAIERPGIKIAKHAFRAARSRYKRLRAFAGGVVRRMSR
jgi:hypothetical protein